jgi:hypothetical protein
MFGGSCNSSRSYLLKPPYEQVMAMMFTRHIIYRTGRVAEAFTCS